MVAPSPARSGPAPRPPAHGTESPQDEEEWWHEELTSSPLVPDAGLPAAHPLPGGSQRLSPVASTWAGEEQRTEICEGPHFLNGVRRRGQQVPWLGADTGVPDPRSPSMTPALT